MIPTTPKKRLPFIVILLIALVAFCIFCIIASFTMDALGLIPTPTPSLPPTNTSLPTQTALPTTTTDPAAEFANKYLNEYGGIYESYTEIYYMTDCTQLQAQFEIAYANNQRETAGTPLFKVTLGYMTAIDERMQSLGCYTTSIATQSQTPLPTLTTFVTETLPPNCLQEYPSFCILPGQRISCDQLPSEFIVLPPDSLGYDGDGDGIGCEN